MKNSKVKARKVSIGVRIMLSLLHINSMFHPFKRETDGSMLTSKFTCYHTTSVSTQVKVPSKFRFSNCPVLNGRLPF